MTARLTMPWHMKTTSLVLLIAFSVFLISAGQYMNLYAEEDDEDDRGVWAFLVDVGKTAAGATATVVGVNVFLGGAAVVGTTGWTGIGTVVGGGAMAGGGLAAIVGFDLASDSFNNLCNDIYDAVTD